MMKKGKNANFIKSVSIMLGIVMLVPMLGGCSRKKPESEQLIQVYYVNSSETGVISQDYELTADINDTNAAIKELVEVLSQMPDRMQYEAPMSGDIHLIGYSLNDRLLTMNFSLNYNNLGRTLEVLDRAAIVRTFTQLDDIDYVSFQIEGTPITDHYGNVIGNMSADTFIYNAGNEINTYEKVELKLYFASEDGKKLIPVYRSVVYNSNIAMEKLAVEQVISGPNTDIAYPTVSKNTKVRSISSKDGVCYIDFDSEFLTQMGNVSAETAIYSIVNTVTELPNINKVAFSVNGESAFTFMDYLISGSYERNLDIVETQ